MTALEQFLEPIKIAGEPLGNEFKAYKMDSNDEKNNMRKTAGLGTCHCCDYFLPQNNAVVLIEDTRLLEKAKDIEEKYDYLNDDHKAKAINKAIVDRMQLKVYGSMLVLCRLAETCTSTKKSIQQKKYHFLMVAGKIETTEDKKYFEHLKATLRTNLLGVLGKKMLSDVSVCLPEDMKTTLATA